MSDLQKTATENAEFTARIMILKLQGVDPHVIKNLEKMNAILGRMGAKG
jgi:hypothetical protein